MSKLSVVIVNWNGEKYLYKCIESLLNQTLNDMEIVFVDNSSTDNSLKLVQENFNKKLKIVSNINNGYAGGANVGINYSNSDYVAIINPDVVFDPEYMERCCDFLEKNYKVAAVTGKLLKYDFDTNEKLNVIDSVGISVRHDRYAYDIGQNEVDIGKYDATNRVFAICGAAAVFKKESLEKIKYENEYFDEDFFAYKEDIDLCWRLNWAGFKCFYIHDALAYHGRAMNSAIGFFEKIKNRKIQSAYLKGISFRNHYLMILKNDTKKTMRKDFLFLLIRLIKFLVFSLVFERSNYRYIKEIFILKNRILRKKHFVMKNRAVDDLLIYNLFE
jgi:GT2 family glycosyltransferase